MNVHLIDGTYELFRHYFGAPPARDSRGREVGAVIGVARSLLFLLRDGATHLGVATDHVIESFRNDLWPGYKTGEGIEPELKAQFHPLEEVLTAMGIRVWPMVEQEADDGLAAAAAKAAGFDDVERIFICTPDKDLGQCVKGKRVVQLDRRAGVLRDAAGVEEKFGVRPESIPDYLALVGDSADGFPGIPRWGAKSSSGILGRYLRLEEIPRDHRAWAVTLRGAAGLADSLFSHWDDALLFRDLATLRTDAPVFDSVEELLWRGPAPGFDERAEELGAPDLAELAGRLARSRGPA